MKRNNRESGQALVFVAVGMVCLLGFVGLGVDMGMLRFQKRNQQTAADAAAVAGASNLGYSGIQTAAQTASSQNGFTDNTGGGACVAPPTSLAIGSITVTVCNRPLTGPHTGDPNYVEAYVSAGQPTYFMRVFGVNSETITARAVATNYSGAGGSTTGDKTGCLYTLGAPSSAIEGVTIGGSAILNAPTCGILDNGNYDSNGNHLQVHADTFGVSGSPFVSGPGGTVTCNGGVASCPTYGVPATSDPMGSIVPPCTGASCVAGPSIHISGGSCSGTGCGNGNVTCVSGTCTVSPGTYSQIEIIGGAANVVFAPGLFIIDGGGSTNCNSSCLNVPSNPTINGTGVTFYFANSATVNITGTPIIHLTAPSSGTYADILMWQDKADINTGPFPRGPALNGNNGSYFNGILYYPSDQLTFSGNTTATSFGVGVVISDSLALSGNPTVNFTGTPGLPGPLPPGSTFGIGRAFLVE